MERPGGGRVEEEADGAKDSNRACEFHRAKRQGYGWKKVNTCRLTDMWGHVGRRIEGRQG